MSNPVLQQFLDGLLLASTDAIKAYKAKLGALGSVEAVMNDAALKVDVGGIMVAGLSGLGAAFKDASSIEDDASIVVAELPAFQNLIAAIKA